MRRREARWIAALLGFAAAVTTVAAWAAEPAPLRFRAPIEVREAAPFVELPLSPAVYAHVEQAGLADLRVVDSRGERVPFAVLAARSSQRSREVAREARLYPLPARPRPDGVWPSPVEVVVEGDRIQVRRSSAPRANAASGLSGGWVIDLGEARPGEAPVRSVRLAWSGPPEFSAGFQLETSDDLRQWRSAGAGQLLSLQSTSGPLTQPLVPLPDRAGRFVRLLWNEPATAPRLTGATAIAPEPERIAIDAPTELAFPPTPEPLGRAAADPTGSDAARRSLHFDLGGALPVVDVDLRFSAGTHVAPVRLQGRVRAADPWSDLGSGVFYRLERGSSVAESPPVPLVAQLRFLRVIPDERAATIEVGQVRLMVHAQLASLVFASQGQPPYALLAGSRDAPAGALPATTLVPRLDEERARFGRAVLGPFGIIETAAREIERAEQRAKLRPWLLWSVLVGGVVLLGALVWRLARHDPARAAQPDRPS
ncbi:MAG TPA: DUF3999 family protein [Caldimonas sp.]|jgi:hypothetical protein|nr:DUF3999 family protein [Caldimonas sp.]HEX2539615.1 DUF3999 family protein [Caldimonas sp.]